MRLLWGHFTPFSGLLPPWGPQSGCAGWSAPALSKRERISHSADLLEAQFNVDRLGGGDHNRTIDFFPYQFLSIFSWLYCCVGLYSCPRPLTSESTIAPYIGSHHTSILHCGGKSFAFLFFAITFSNLLNLNNYYHKILRLENVAIANALQLEAARTTPVLFRFNYTTPCRSKSR